MLEQVTEALNNTKNVRNKAMKKFELFMGCLGNGITVCNKAVEQYGDYKKVCHISEHGKITWYVNIDYVPGNDLLKIEHQADVLYHKFINMFDSWEELKQYQYLLDRAKHIDYMQVISMKDATITEKIQYLKNIVLNY